VTIAPVARDDDCYAGGIRYGGHQVTLLATSNSHSIVGLCRSIQPKID
jgi:hypothetical protein